MRAIALLVLAGLALAGCTSAPSPLTSTDASSTQAHERVHGNRTIIPVDAVLWANGTFQPQDTCDTGGCILGAFVGSGHTHDTDVGSLVHAGAPTRIRAVLQQSPVTTGNLWLRLQANDQTVLWVDVREGENGLDTMDALVVRVADGPIAVRVFAEKPEAGTMDYTLRIHVEALRNAVVPGLPVALPLEHPETLRVVSLDGSSPAPLLVWGPDDRFLGILTPGTEGRLPLAEPAGEYVVVLSGVGEAVRLLSQGVGNATLRSLGVEPVLERVGTLTGSGEATWGFTLDGTAMPLAVGVAVRGDGAVGFVSEPGGSVLGPKGEVLSIGPQDQTLGVDLSTLDRLYTSRIGHPLLVPGDYTGRFSMKAGGQEAVEKATLRYVR